MLLGQFVNTAVTIDDDILRQLWVYTCAADGEVSALGEIDIHDHGIHVTKVMHFLRQVGSMGGTRIGGMELVRLLMMYDKEGRDPRRLRFWFHTHGSGHAFFSNTDETTIEKLHSTFGWEVVVAACFNTHGETQWRIRWNEFQLDWSFTIPGDAPSESELLAAKHSLSHIIKPRRRRDIYLRLLKGNRFDG